MKIECKCCGNKFYVPYCRKNAKFCSRKCYFYYYKDCHLSKGIKRSKETIEKIRKARKGFKHTEEAKKKMSESHKGAKVSKKHRENLSKALKGRKLPKEQVDHLRKVMTGKKASAETKKKMSEAQKGRKHNWLTKYRIGKAQKGEKGNNWNPDREWVKKRKIVFTFMVSSINRLLHNKNGKRSEEILGYTKEELMEHLESKFEKRMTWSNHGVNKYCWQIDHIKPISAFLKEGVEDPKIVNALSNLQPLWASENASKQNKWKDNK